MRPKIKLLVLASSLMLFFTNLYSVVFVAAASLLLVLVLGLWGRFLPWLRPLVIVFVIIVILQSFTYAGIGFSIAGLYNGLFFSVRLFSLLTLVFLFVQTTSPGRLAEAFGFLPGAVSQVLVMALSLIPNVARLAESIMNAQKCRGLNFRSLNITRTYFPLLVPLFAKTLDRSEKMALAMQARGFDSD
jgi:energy-coupling factor transport system permease protein